MSDIHKDDSGCSEENWWGIRSPIRGGKLGFPVLIWKRANGSDWHGSRTRWNWRGSFDMRWQDLLRDWMGALREQGMMGNLFLFLTAFSRHNSHTVQFAHKKYTIHWFLIVGMAFLKPECVVVSDT